MATLAKTLSIAMASAVARGEASWHGLMVLVFVRSCVLCSFLLLFLGVYHQWTLEVELSPGLAATLTVGNKFSLFLC